jgi:hypothetical protein
MTNIQDETAGLQEKQDALAEANNLPENFNYPIIIKGRPFVLQGKKEITDAINAGIKEVIQEISSIEVPIASVLGKRFFCLLCKKEALCTKAGLGVLSCCGQPMLIRKPKPIPSSD